MHIVLGLLATIVTILLLLHRLAEAGIDLGGLNPFLWRRRRTWRKKYEGSPLYALDSPMDVAGLFIVATAKCDGEISAGQKQLILRTFEQAFHLSGRDASALLASSVHVLAAATDLSGDAEKILARSRERFTVDQTASTVDLMERVAALEGGPTSMQLELIEAVRSAFSNAVRPGQERWGRES